MAAALTIELLTQVVDIESHESSRLIRPPPGIVFPSEPILRLTRRAEFIGSPTFEELLEALKDSLDKFKEQEGVCFEEVNSFHNNEPLERTKAREAIAYLLGRDKEEMPTDKFSELYETFGYDEADSRNIGNRVLTRRLCRQVQTLLETQGRHVQDPQKVPLLDQDEIKIRVPLIWRGSTVPNDFDRLILLEYFFTMRCP